MKGQTSYAGRLICSGVVVVAAGIFCLRAAPVGAQVVDETKGGTVVYETDGWYYSNRYEGCIGPYGGTEEDITIPTELDGHEFWKIHEQLYSYDKDAKIKVNGFSDSVKTITIPEEIIRINSYEGEGSDDDWSPYEETEYLDTGIISGENLEAIHVAEGNPCFSSQDGVLFSKDGTHLLQYPKAKGGSVYRIPDGVKYVCVSAFGRAKNLVTLIVPESVEIIESYSFSWIPTLRNIYFLGASEDLKVKEAFDNTFYDGKNDVKLDNKLTFYGQKNCGIDVLAEEAGAEFKTFTLPSVTKVEKKVSNKGSISLTWKKSSKAKGYGVYRKMSKDGEWELLSATTSLSYKETIKKPIGAWYQIRPYTRIEGEVVYGSSSPELFVMPKPDAVKSLSAKKTGTKKALLRWKTLKSAKNIGCVGYEVHRYDEAKGKYVKIGQTVGAAKVTYTDKTRKKGAVYSYKVRAYNEADGQRTYGAFSSVVKI